MLAMALAPTTPLTLEIEKRCLPSSLRVVTVLRTAYPVRPQNPCLPEAK